MQLEGNRKPSRPTSLTPAHSRALTSHFKTVEEYLRVVAFWMDGFEGIFYGAPAELSQEQRAHARTVISEVLGGLRRVRQGLGLERQQMSSIGIMRAYLSELWVSLVETRSRYLRGYGEVPPELADYLDCRVGELESRVNELRHLVEAAAKPEGDRPAGSGDSRFSETRSEPFPEPPLDPEHPR